MLPVLNELNTWHRRRQDNGEDGIQGHSEESSEEMTQIRTQDRNKDETQDYSMFLGAIVTMMTMHTPGYHMIASTLV